MRARGGIFRNYIVQFAARGCDLFNLDELPIEYAPDEFANLLMCQFGDDSLLAFKFNERQRCTVDAMVDWTDVDMLAKSPVGNREVWAGFDPQESEDGDKAGFVIERRAHQAGTTVGEYPPAACRRRNRAARLCRLHPALRSRRHFVLPRPPYWGCETDYGQDVFSRADFNKLADQLAGINGRFILSINDTPGVRATFARFDVGTAETTYTVSAGPAQKAGELIAR